MPANTSNKKNYLDLVNLGPVLVFILRGHFDPNFHAVAVILVDPVVHRYALPPEVRKVRLVR